MENGAGDNRESYVGKSISAQFREYGGVLLRRFDGLRDRYGKSANNLRGIISTSVSLLLLGSGVGGRSVTDFVSGVVFLSGNILDASNGDKDRNFHRALLISATGEFLAFSRHLVAGEWGSIIALPSLFVYYGAGLCENKLTARAENFKPGLLKRVLGNPRPVMAGADILGAVAPLVQAVSNHEWLWAGILCGWLAEAVVHAVSTSENFRNGHNAGEDHRDGKRTSKFYGKALRSGASGDDKIAPGPG